MNQQIKQGNCVPMNDALRTVVARFVPHLKHIETAVVLSACETTVVQVGNEVVVKYGPNVTSIEAESIRFVSELTSVPVPHVYGVHQVDDGNTYFVMEFVPGLSLSCIWHNLSVLEKENITKELAKYFGELHKTKGTYIGAVGRHPCRDIYFDDIEDKGPFESEQLMNKAIVCAPRYNWKPSQNFIDSTLSCLPHDHDIVFSHGDLCPGHVIVDDGNKTVRAIIGWRGAGFFPVHWDFVNALTFTDWNSDWVLYVQKFFTPYYEEYSLWYSLRELAVGM